MDERHLDQKIEKVLREQSLPEHSNTWADETLKLMLDPLGSDLDKELTGSDLRGQGSKKSKTAQYILRGTLTVAASLIIGLGGLMLGAIYNPSLAESMMKWPLVGQWVEYLVGKPGLKSAIEHERYQPIDKVIKIDDTEITLNGVVADQQTLAVYYSINGEHSEAFVELSLEIPDFKSAIGIEFSGMGENVRLSEIRTYGHDIPDTFTLAFTLEDKVFRFPVELDQSMSLESVYYELSQPLEISKFGSLEITEISIGEINASVKARLRPADGIHDLNIGLYLMDQNGNKIYFDSMGRLNSDAEVEEQFMEFKASISRFELDGSLFIGIDPQRSGWQSDVLSTVYFDTKTETVHSELQNESAVILYKGREVSVMSDISGNQAEKPWITYEFLRPGLMDRSPEHSGNEFGAIRMEPDPAEMSVGMWQTDKGLAFNIGIPEDSKVERMYLSLFEPFETLVLEPVEVSRVEK